jgi:hypothetical protein
MSSHLQISTQEAAEFHDWGKMEFYEYPPRPWPALLAEASETECDLVGSLVRYESESRMAAAQVSRISRHHKVNSRLTACRR